MSSPNSQHVAAPDRRLVASSVVTGPLTNPTTGSTDKGKTAVRVLGRSPALDGLRAVAVLIVFASHVEAFLPLATLLVVPGGTVGLDPFFVLSGFLITALLLKEQSQYGTIRRWAFYKRRIVRLLPPLFFLLVANVIFALAINAWSRQQVESLVSVIFYYSNYYQAKSPNLFCANLATGYEHLWSLSFEEQFYLIWPWIVIGVLTINRSIRTVAITILGTIAVIGIHRALAYHSVANWCYLFHATGRSCRCSFVGMPRRPPVGARSGADEAHPDTHLAGRDIPTCMPALLEFDRAVLVQRRLRFDRPLFGNRPSRPYGGSMVGPPLFRVDTAGQVRPYRLCILFVARDHLLHYCEDRPRVELRSSSGRGLWLDPYHGIALMVFARKAPPALGP